MKRIKLGIGVDRRYHPRNIPRKKKKVAVMGGSFNPITRGHLKLGKTVFEAIPDMEAVWLMPAYRHPFRKHAEYAEHRVRMIRMVETERLRYFSYEIDHKLTGETYVTFKRLLDDPDYKDYDFHMVVGSDCVLEFDEKWKHADLLAEMVTFIIVLRPGYPLDGYDGLLSRPPHIHLTEAAMPDVSSTRVRRNIRCGESIRGLVPEPVRNFIREKHLYEGECESRTDSHRGGDASASTDSEDGDNPAEGSARKPSVSVNIAVCTIREERLKVLLTKRNRSSRSDSWAIPGVFPDAEDNDPLDAIAAKQLEKITGLREFYIEQLKTYGPPDHETPGRIITVAYFALIPEEKLLEAENPGEASDNRWFCLKGFQKEIESSGMETAFGHARILEDLLTRIRGKISYAPIAFELVPEPFTWPELRRAFEIILGQRLDATNFKRKIRSLYDIRELNGRPADKSVGRPPSRLRFEGVKDIYL